MTKRKYKIIAVFGIVVLLSIGMMFYAVSVNHLYCSPTEPRGNDVETWQETITPNQAAVQLDENFFDSFTIRSYDNCYIIQHPVKNRPENPFAFDVMELTIGESLEIGGGTMEFSGIATAYHDASQAMDDEGIYSFYDRQFQSIATPSISQFGNYGNNESGINFSNSSFPFVKFLFEYGEIENLMIHGIRVFDSRTLEYLTSGRYFKGTDYFWFYSQIPLWHKTPIDLVIEISYEPSKIFEFAPRAGEGFREGNFDCLLLGVFDGVEPGSQISGSLDEKMNYKLPIVPKDEAGRTFFFACQPTARQMPVTFELLDKDGNVIDTDGSSTSIFTHSIGLLEAVQNIALIRACYRTERKRIIIHLPYIPGLPQQNETIDNLFDLYVPYARLQNSAELGNFLERTLQLSRTVRTGPVPQYSINDVAFPLEFRDVTLRDIAKTYAEGGSLSVDIENDQLIREYPVPLLTRLKQYIQKIFR